LIFRTLKKEVAKITKVIFFVKISANFDNFTTNAQIVQRFMFDRES
jgi:hypothetical protein